MGARLKFWRRSPVPKKGSKVGSRKLHICLKVTKMVSIIGQRIEYNGVGALRRQRHIPSKKN